RAQPEEFALRLIRKQIATLRMPNSHMPDPSTKPYLMRAIYEWCVDSGYTPYLSVTVDSVTRVPMEYVKDGQIVLNIGLVAVERFKIGNDLVEFSARFNGRGRELSIPV